MNGEARAARAKQSSPINRGLQFFAHAVQYGPLDVAQNRLGGASSASSPRIKLATKLVAARTAVSCVRGIRVDACVDPAAPARILQ
jgi:hypothetical protein